MFAVIRLFFLSVLGKLPLHYLIETRVFEKLLKDMTMESLDRQLKLMAFMMVYVEICVRWDVSIYYKATGINMQNVAVAEVIVIKVHILQ